MSDNDEPKLMEEFEKVDDTSRPAEAAAGDTATCGAGSDGRMLLCCSYLERMDPKVKQLVLWSDPKLSAAALLGLLAVLIACMWLSFISVLAYAGLAAMLCTSALRLYGCAMRKPGAEAPGGQLMRCLDNGVQLPKQCIVQCVEQRLECAEKELSCLMELLAFRDKVRTLKFFLCLILMTYIGCWFNALTLVTLAVISAFCLPKAYAVYYKKVDCCLAAMIEHYRMANAKIRSVIPFGKDKKN